MEELYEDIIVALKRQLFWAKIIAGVLGGGLAAALIVLFLKIIL